MVDQVRDRTRNSEGFTKEAFVTVEVTTTAATTTVVSAITLAVTTENALTDLTTLIGKARTESSFSLNNGSDFKLVHTSSVSEVVVGRSFSAADQ